MSEKDNSKFKPIWCNGIDYCLEIRCVKLCIKLTVIVGKLDHTMQLTVPAILNLALFVDPNTYSLERETGSGSEQKWEWVQQKDISS